MYAVGRLGSYISHGVYTVSGAFHPFGGAVDIIVVEQQDGSFKSSPWYVRFGKFQGVLKTKEKAVNINVNGVEADFHMYLDHKGEAYFLREVDGEEGDSVFYPSSSGEETDGQSSDRRPMKSKSYIYDADQSNLVTKIDVSHGKILTRTSSRRSRILGLVFGRKSMKENRSREEEDGPVVVRADSLERAEIAADLLEVNWSTNLASSRRRKDNLAQFSAPDISGSEADKDLPISNGRTETDSPMNDNTINSLDPPVLHEELGIHDNGMGTSSMFGFQKLGSSDKEFGVEVSCLNTEHIIGTSNLGESGLQENFDLNCETMTEIDGLGVTNADHENAKIFVWETHSPDSDSAELNACPSKKLNKELDFKEKDILLPGHDVSEESGADRVEAFIYSETLESSRVGQDNSGGKTDETSYVSCEGGAVVRVHAKTLHETAKLISEVNSLQETTSLVKKEPLDFPELLADANCGNFFNDAQILGSEGTSSNSFANCSVTEAYTQMVAVDPINGSVKELDSCSICTIYGSNHSIYEVHDGENMRDEDTMSKLQHSLKPIGASQEFKCDIASVEAITVSPSEGSDEEELLFGDLDDYNHEEVKRMESMSSNHVERESHPPVTPKGSEAVTESPSPNDESYTSSDKFVQESMPKDVEDFRQKSRIVSSSINICRSNKIVGEDIGRMAESLPNMWSPIDGLVVVDLHHSLGYSLDLNSESSKWISLREDVSSCIKSDAEKEDLVFQAQPMAQISEELENVPADLAVGELSKAIDASTESWRAWPFPFKRSRSMKTNQPARNSTRGSDAESTLETTSGMDGEKDVLKPKVKKKNVRAITPTPEELASLNLKEGNNTVTFTFSTSMLGPRQVDARIFLWKWDTRVVISDVDGTITKSDVLGQFMPLVGMDWSQTGVAHLFSAIKENGYQLLFLSARAISQAYHTRQFLFNLKQNGKALPDGPVVISPDGLFPSLFREVIRRAPHEFKIACLEDIKALFPSDRNPFYAGFGNRDTDEFSYLKVGIPKGKIFIINPKGEVAVHHRVDTKSYTSLHALVHDMFPPMSSSEQEDFNSWNFWKLPPPDINF